MTIIMYERVGFEGRRPSPFSWRIRHALTHKGIDVEYRPVRFADVDIIKRLSGQHFVPIIVDGSKVVHDSWQIALTSKTALPTSRPCLAARLPAAPRASSTSGRTTCSIPRFAASSTRTLSGV